MDEEDDDMSSGTLGSLAGLVGTTSPEGQREALRILQNYSDDEESGVDPEEEILAKMRKNADEVRAALQRARQRLVSQRYNPGEALLAASAALGQPTTHGGRSGTLEAFANAMGAIRDPLARRSEFNRQRDSSMLDLDAQEAGVDNTVNAAELQLAQLKRRLRSADVGHALTALRGSGGSRGGALRESKIRDVMIQLLPTGMDPMKAYNHAVNVVDGNEKIEVVPNLGIVRGTNVVDGTAWEVPLGRAKPPPGPDGSNDTPDTVTPSGPRAKPDTSQVNQQPTVGATPTGEPSTDPRDVLQPDEMTIYDAARLGTGWWSGLKQGWSVLAGNVGLPVADETAKARQALATNAQYMLRALSVDPNDPSVKEIERIRSDINLLPSMSDNPKLMQIRVGEIDTGLRALYQRAVADAEDTSLSDEFRSKRRSLAASIRSFLPVLGFKEKPGDIPVPAGIPPEVSALWQYMTPEARERAVKIYGPK